ncbi:hypothetical protein ABC766_30285 [Methylobacterium fujisawaense]|uniref:hypothetical protein n=1 Tax=Methylobacterium fujisawaense TaxID=107400 RepID=UPI0031F5B364
MSTTLPDRDDHPPAGTVTSGTPDRSRRPTLDVRFVIRISATLDAAIAACAGEEGVTASAWARQRLLDAIGLRSPIDAQSAQPTRRPPEDIVAISAAVRELAAVNAALAMNDGRAARASLDQVRAILIPMVVRLPPR